MKTIFVIDDNETNRVAAKTALDGKYITYALPSAERMFRMLERITPDLILLDVSMPDMGGFEALGLLKASDALCDIPVIFLTARSDDKTEVSGFNIGAVDFIHKPFSPAVLIRRIETHIEIDDIVKKNLRNMRKAYEATISNMAEMVEGRDHNTGGHIQRTKKYLTILVRDMLQSDIYAEEISEWDLDIVSLSSQLHDVGKVKVSDAILNKPAPLTEEEFDEVKKHCADGEELIEKIIDSMDDAVFLRHAKNFAATHHEKWDGSGYPRGLRGEEIPLEGRIMAVVDVYDALVSERPYKQPIPHEDAVEVIRNDSGSHFDPTIVELFLTISYKFKDVFPGGMVE